jgi:AcrR family transcriptional regulator
LLPARATADGTLRRMLLSALVLFAERGYHAVPVREIARGAGIRASSMYEHRASKEKLLLDLMLIGHEEHNAQLVAALHGADDDPRSQIDAVVRAHVRVHATYPMLTRVCNRELGSLNEDSLSTVLEVRRATERVLTTTIERGIEEGVFSVPDSYLATAALGAMGIRVAEWYRPNSDLSIDAVADAYAVFSLRLLGATGAP